VEQHSRGNMLVICSAVCFGLMPIFARFAYQNHVEVQELLLVRFVLAFLVMGLFLLLTRRRFVPPRKQLLVLLALGGVGYFLQASLYFTSLLYVPVSIVSLILYTYPAFVVAGSLMLRWEKPSVSLGLCLFLALVGLALVANPVGHIVSIGLLMALGASVTYTVYILVSSRVLKDVSGELACIDYMGAAALSFLASDSLTGRMHISWDFQAWVWVILISIISTCLAITAFFQGVKLIGPSRASILSAIDPVTSVIAASILFSEFLNVYQCLGGLLIILAATVATFSKKTR